MPVCDNQIQHWFYQAISTTRTRTFFCTSCPTSMSLCVLSYTVKIRKKFKIKYSTNSTHNLTVLRAEGANTKKIILSE